MLALRPYQQAAVQAVYDYLRRHDDNPAVVLPTAAGKSWCIAQLAKDALVRWEGRVLVLAHVKELLEQNADKIRRLCPELAIGVYSAGLKRRDTEHAVIVAGIQPVYKRACELDAFDLVIVDEAHLIPPEGEGMYRTFLAEAKVVNPRLRTIGLTAMPFRMKSGMICGRENILNHVCFEVGVRELIRDGYANCANYPGALKASGLYFSQAIIWDKEHPVLTRKGFMGAREWCFYCWREGAAHPFFGPNNATDLWHVRKVNPNKMVHLTENLVAITEVEE